MAETLRNAKKLKRARPIYEELIKRAQERGAAAFVTKAKERITSTVVDIGKGKLPIQRVEFLLNELREVNLVERVDSRKGIYPWMTPWVSFLIQVYEHEKTPWVSFLIQVYEHEKMHPYELECVDAFVEGVRPLLDKQRLTEAQATYREILEYRDKMLIPKLREKDESLLNKLKKLNQSFTKLEDLKEKKSWERLVDAYQQLAEDFGGLDDGTRSQAKAAVERYIDDLLAGKEIDTEKALRIVGEVEESEILPGRVIKKLRAQIESYSSGEKPGTDISEPQNSGEGKPPSPDKETPTPGKEAPPDAGSKPPSGAPQAAL